MPLTFLFDVIQASRIIWGYIGYIHLWRHIEVSKCSILHIQWCVVEELRCVSKMEVSEVWKLHFRTFHNLQSDLQLFGKCRFYVLRNYNFTRKVPTAFTRKKQMKIKQSVAFQVSMAVDCFESAIFLNKSIYVAIEWY